ncbi:MAG: 6-phosphogluconolactonase [Candidatus Woesearchaeota archaeon]
MRNSSAASSIAGMWLKSSMIKTLYNKNRELLAKQAVEIIGKAIEKLVAERGFAVLGIPSGRSVKELFAEFAVTNKINWKKVHIFWVDDRMVNQDDPDSNYKLAHDSFLKIIAKENMHGFCFDPNIDGQGVKQYNREFAGFARFDIVILSSGEDGHVAALYPDHHSIKNKQYRYFTMDDSPKPPIKRMTASRSMLEASRVAITLFIGEAKRTAYERFMNKELPVESCPVKLLENIEESYILTDIR